MKKLIIILILGLLAFSNSFLIDFLWDDVGIIVHNPLIKQVKLLPKIFTTGLFVGELRSRNFYRPIQTLTNILDFHLWRGQRAGYHLTNILLHLACAWLFYRLFSMIFKKESLAFLSAVLFTLHPVNVETVAYISGRADSLALLFLLLSFINYLKFSQLSRSRFFLYSLIYFTLAIFSKELSISAIFIYPLIDYLLDKKLKIWHYSCFGAIAAGFFCLRFLVLGLPQQINSFNISTRVLTFAYNIFDYIKILFLPINLHMSYTSEIFSRLNILIIVRLAAVFLFFLFLYLKLRPERKAFIFCASWFFIFLIPQSGIIPINAYFAEHFIYLCEYPLFFIVLLALSKSLNKFRKRILYAIFWLIALGLLLTTFNYTKIWADPIAFYSRIIRLSKNSFSAYNNLGAELQKRGLRNEARQKYLSALSINPNDVLTYNNLGKSYLEEGDYKKAIAIFKQAIEKDPKRAVLHYNLAMAYEVSADAVDSLTEYEKAFKLAKEIAPWDASIYLKLGILYYKTGRNPEAVEEFKQAIRLDESDPAFYVNLGLAYKALGFYQESEVQYLRALQLEPNFSQAHNNLGVIYALVGDTKKALKYLTRALELDDQYYEARFNLGLLYNQIEEFEKALEQLKGIPSDVSFYPLVRQQLQQINIKINHKKH